MAKFVQRLPGGFDPTLEKFELEFETQEELLNCEFIQNFANMSWSSWCGSWRLEMTLPSRILRCARSWRIGTPDRPG